MIFVDTNYFLRFLLNDNELQYLRAKELFVMGARGEKRLITSTIVFFEIYWVFKSYYQKNRADLNALLKKILDMNFIKLEERDKLNNSLNLFNKTNLSLEDCYNVYYAKSRSVKTFITFDSKLSKQFEKHSFQ